MVGRIEWIPDGSGTFACFRSSGNGIDWIAPPDHEPQEQFARSARSVGLAGFEVPVIEVLGQTHQGNGNLHLYLLEGRRLRRVLSTRAVDHGNDGEGFDGGLLHIVYRDLNGDGWDDVVLSGLLQTFPEQGPPIVLTSTYLQHQFLWKPTAREFRGQN